MAVEKISCQLNASTADEDKKRSRECEKVVCAYEYINDMTKAFWNGTMTRTRWKFKIETRARTFSSTVARSRYQRLSH